MTDQARADILAGADIAGLKKSTSSQTWAFIVMLILLCVGPWIFYPVFLMKVLCFAMFACGFNLLLGYAGMMSFGHAAFFGMGSYIAAWTGLYWHWPIELSLSAAGAVAQEPAQQPGRELRRVRRAAGRLRHRCAQLQEPGTDRR